MSLYAAKFMSIVSDACWLAQSGTCHLPIGRGHLLLSAQTARSRIVEARLHDQVLRAVEA
jgi:hypothetical protein